MLMGRAVSSNWWNQLIIFAHSLTQIIIFTFNVIYDKTCFKFVFIHNQFIEKYIKVEHDFVNFQLSVTLICNSFYLIYYYLMFLGNKHFAMSYQEMTAIIPFRVQFDHALLQYFWRLNTLVMHSSNFCWIYSGTNGPMGSSDFRYLFVLAIIAYYLIKNFMKEKHIFKRTTNIFLHLLVKIVHRRIDSSAIAFDIFNVCVYILIFHIAELLGLQYFCTYLA